MISFVNNSALTLTILMIVVSFMDDVQCGNNNIIIGDGNKLKGNDNIRIGAQGRI